MMDSVGIRDRDTRKGAVSPVQNETICGWPHPTVPSTPPPGPLKLLAEPKMRTAVRPSSTHLADNARRSNDAGAPLTKQIHLRRRGQLLEFLAVPLLARDLAHVTFGSEFRLLQVAQDFLFPFPKALPPAPPPRHPEWE